MKSSHNERKLFSFSEVKNAFQGEGKEIFVSLLVFSYSFQKNQTQNDSNTLNRVSIQGRVSLNGEHSYFISLYLDLF